MKTHEVCKYLKCTISQLRELQKVLGIHGSGSGTIKDYSKLEIARLKAGVKHKDYVFVQDEDRYWIFYGLSDSEEIKIEV